jgi:hypothetical protein
MKTNDMYIVSMTEKAPNIYLFMINGLGLGNSTRCHAIIENLLKKGAEIHVMTSGNGLEFFRKTTGLASLTSVDAFFYSGVGGRVSFWRTFLSFGKLIGIARRKRAQLEELLTKVKPDVAGIDSEYSLQPLKKRNIPIVAINNSDVVVSEFLRLKNFPFSVLGQFWGVEFMDYLFHRFNCDMVLSPSILPVPVRHPRCRRIGLIVRNELCDFIEKNEGRPFPAPRSIKNVVFMLSGSIFASDIGLGENKLPFHIDVVGRDGTNTESVTFHGKLMNNISLLEKADVLVINGGFSAVSEAVALRKPTFVIPVPGHAEQYANALALKNAGLGYIVSAGDVLSELLQIYEINHWGGLKQPTPVLGIHGAAEAADMISDFADKHCRRSV